MRRLPPFVAALGVALSLGLATAVPAPDDENKDKNTPTFDDATATLIQTVAGKETKKKVGLNYCLKVKGHFAADGFHIDDVAADGPAAHLSDPNGQTAAMEKGDVITAVEGKRIKSVDDYVKAMNGAADHAKTKIKVRDVNSGNEAELTAEAEKR